MSKFKKATKSLDSKSATIRELPEIEQEVSNLLMRLGNAQYRRSLFAKDVKDIEAKLIQVNQEGAARIALNEAKAKSETKEA